MKKLLLTLITAIPIFGLAGCGIDPGSVSVPDDISLPTSTSEPAGPDIEEEKIKEIYNLYVQNGGVLSYQDWLKSIKGEKGDTGKSAYQLAVENGFQGTVQEWLASLKGHAQPDGGAVYVVGSFYDEAGDFILYYSDDSYVNVGKVGFGGNTYIFNTLRYTLGTDNAYTVAKTTLTESKSGLLNVPGYINNKTVKRVAERAFYDCADITDIVFGQGVEKLGGDCFYGCISLTNVLLPSSVTDISPYVFYDNSLNVYYDGSENNLKNLVKNLVDGGTNYYYLDNNGSYSYNNKHYSYYDKTIIDPSDFDSVMADPDYLFFYTGQYSNWEARDEYQMTAMSVNQVATIDASLANTIVHRPVKYLYGIQVTLSDGHEWAINVTINDAIRSIDGNYQFKITKGHYDSLESVNIIDKWIPNPADISPEHVEPLNSGVYVPPYQKDFDQDGLNWNSNLMFIDGEGTYFVVIAEYTNPSTTTQPGYGIGAIKLS